MKLSPEQQIQFESQGFLRVPGALVGEELSRVRAAANRAEEAWRNDPSLPGERSDSLHQVQAIMEYDEELLKLLWHPQTFPLVRAMLGDDVMMIDHDYFITPARTTSTHHHWHHDVGLTGVYHPRSVMMVKVFFLLSDVDAASGGTAMIPGSHRFDPDFVFPDVMDPKSMPGAIQMTGQAGDAYLFNGRVYHCAVVNESDRIRRVLIYNYGHFWMKMWPGYEPSARLLRYAEDSGDPVIQQLLGIGHAYGQRLPA